MRSRKHTLKSGGGLKSVLSELSTKRETKRKEKKEKQIIFNKESMNLAEEIVMNVFRIVRHRLNKKNKSPLEKAAYKIIRTDDTFLKELHKDKLYFMPLPYNPGYKSVHTLRITSTALAHIKPLSDGTFYYDNSL